MTTGETIVTITDEQSVRTMVWALFSLFPAVIAALVTLLAYKFPLKK
jgi:GPH family glycoside/pentoside/hexuronide:cation symporter